MGLLLVPSRQLGLRVRLSRLPAMSAGRGKRWRILERDGFTCRYCGRSAPYVVLEVDHVVARSMGGSDHASNLVTACFDCNQGKKARDGSVGLDMAVRLDNAEMDASVSDHFMADAQENAAAWRNEAIELADELQYVRNRLIDYEVLAEEHGWFEE